MGPCSALFFLPYRRVLLFGTASGLSEGLTTLHA